MLAAHGDLVQSILQVSVVKMKYHPTDYAFDQPEEDEEAFQTFRDNLKTIIFNIAQLVRRLTACLATR